MKRLLTIVAIAVLTGIIKTYDFLSNTAINDPLWRKHHGID